ncbi:tRNA/rRNA methyltransferase, SpoU type [Dillenia turbinata]|uniref:rRNA methyltransferase 1, mitochondrial n=1 Tax=Dillenia turbinata TaxID=194707 RepID=A0AAN8VWD1_9MAGN
MYCNLSRSNISPLAFSLRATLYQTCALHFPTSKPQFLPLRFCEKPTLTLAESTNYLVTLHTRALGNCKGDRPRSGFNVGKVLQCPPLLKARSFSSLQATKLDEGGDVVSSGKAFPWLAEHRRKEVKRVEKVISSSWEESAKRFSPRNGKSERSRGSRPTNLMERRRTSSKFREERYEVGEDEAANDSPWYKINDKFSNSRDEKPTPEKPETRRWDKQENWGRKTWREATESTLPKIVGEGVYGVGPILAALSAGRREFYALYVQEGIDLSSNNRKKKDKKGFEKILRIAERIGLSKKEVSKHDLNMVVDNRPHQGLVLDASPLELVNIRELDSVSVDGEIGPLWVALDEVTDPQNLGAIIRSSYFFGASGVVLCAKNSAPLSGVVSKASAGSLEIMELRSCKNMMQFLSSSAENGWRVLGGSVSARALPLNEVAPGPPTILVLGSEGTGLRPLVERSCNDLIRIPGNFSVDLTAGVEENETAEMDSGHSPEAFRSFLAVESLNVSVAAGVLLHHLTEKDHVKN